MNSEIIIYQNLEGNIKIDVRLKEETVWLNQGQICELFQKSKATISEHLKNVFEEGELNARATVRKFRTVQTEGNRSVEREIDHYNLDLIISVGYRVKSPQGTQFRIWATQRLKEYIIKGFALNDDRFKSGSSMNYFKDSILQINGRELLSHAGKVSHEKALHKSETEFEKFRITQKTIEKEQSLKEIEADIKKLKKPKT